MEFSLEIREPSSFKYLNLAIMCIWKLANFQIHIFFIFKWKAYIRSYLGIPSCLLIGQKVWDNWAGQLIYDGGV